MQVAITLLSFSIFFFHLLFSSLFCNAYPTYQFDSDQTLSPRIHPLLSNHELHTASSPSGPAHAFQLPSLRPSSLPLPLRTCSPIGRSLPLHTFVICPSLFTFSLTPTLFTIQRSTFNIHVPLRPVLVHSHPPHEFIHFNIFHF